MYKLGLNNLCKILEKIEDILCFEKEQFLQGNISFIFFFFCQRCVENSECLKFLSPNLWF